MNIGRKARLKNLERKQPPHTNTPAEDLFEVLEIEQRAWFGEEYTPTPKTKEYLDELEKTLRAEREDFDKRKEQTNG